MNDLIQKYVEIAKEYFNKKYEKMEEALSPEKEQEIMLHVQQYTHADDNSLERPYKEATQNTNGEDKQETQWEYLQRTGEERLSSYDQERLQEMQKRWDATSTDDETDLGDEDKKGKD